MKAPKYIKAIAQAHTEQDAKEYSFIAENMDSWIESNIRELLNVKEAILKGRIYLGVESVSRSGMSRTIKIRYIKDNKLHNVTDMIYSLAGCNSKRRIDGCGMDMLFQAQYNLFQALCPNHDYRDDMPRYNEL